MIVPDGGEGYAPFVSVDKIFLQDGGGNQASVYLLGCIQDIQIVRCPP